MTDVLMVDALEHHIHAYNTARATRGPDAATRGDVLSTSGLGECGDVSKRES